MGEIDDVPWAQRRLTMEAWATPDGLEVESDYSRTVWLPALGPGTWLVWASAADHLRGLGQWVGTPHALTRPPDVGVDEVAAGLEALALAGLARRLRADHWRVQITCPAPDRPATLRHYDALRRQAARERQEKRPLVAVPVPSRRSERASRAR